MRQCSIQLGDLLRRGALLGAVHRRGTVLTREGVVDVAGDRDVGWGLRVGQGRVQPGEVEAGSLRQRGSALRDGFTGVVEHFRAERLQQARTAVGGGAAADADDDPAAAGVEGCGNDLARAPAGGREGNEPPTRQLGEATDVSELDDGLFVARAQEVSTGSPVGPAAVSACRVKPAATAASTVPSPPSATGTMVTSMSGDAALRPVFRAEATSAALRVPLNLSGAMTT